jgi:hypothetical protein
LLTKLINVGDYGGQGDKPKIMGSLVSYSILGHPKGMIFPVREGKKYIGAGTVSREPGDPQRDDFIPDDPKLSAAHALILYGPCSRQIAAKVLF